MVCVGKNKGHLLSTIATSDGHGENSSYFEGWKAYEDNPFHPTENPDGVIQMGLAENQLSFDLIRQWMTKNPEASICTAKGLNEFMDVAIFQDYHGLKMFRQAVAKFMAKARGGRVSFDPDRIVMSGGATGAHETISFCLADPGEAFLVPTPYYPGFDRDLRWRTGVKLIPVMSDSSSGFQITVKALEAAYENARESNIRVKGLLITNPSNPLGTILDRETLKSLVKFINEKNIHLICDEIYAATTFGQPDFTSVAEILGEVEKCDLDLIHIVYSLSKDMGLPGFRIGIVYSYNDQVVSCARKMSSFGLVSTQTQYLISKMLSDDAFVDDYITKSKLRLGERHESFTTGLKKLDIGSLKSDAGLFVWMDLRKLLKNQTFGSELELWRLIIHKVKLNVSPGSSFHCSEPGWFRVCFANMDENTMEIALKRIADFMAKNKEEMVAKRKKFCRQKSLRLSFGATRRYEDGLVTPRIFSPHSPFPQSPLVRATT